MPAESKTTEILAKVTYTTGKDAGAELYLPVYPCRGDAWRAGVQP